MNKVFEMPPGISRRDFLKLTALLPFLNIALSRYIGQIAARSGGSTQPNILIIVLDSLSASNMSLYGYPRQTTPNISRFAERATVFHHHYAGGNFTTPGTASLFTGTYPWSHRAVSPHSTTIDAFTTRNIFSLVPNGTYTINYTHNLLANSLLYQFRRSLSEFVMPRALAISDPEYSDLIFHNDYNISFVGEDSTLRGEHKKAGSLFLSILYHLIESNYEQSLYNKYKKQFPSDIPNQDGFIFFFEDAINWTINQVKTIRQPYLAYLHFLPPHAPYNPRSDFLGIFNDDISFINKPDSFASEGFTKAALRRNRLKYDQFLAYTDSELGRLLDALEQEGVFENTYVILTSDHGELFERGIRGHITPVLYEPIVHIPLIISRPGINARQDVFTPTSCVDLLATIQHIYGHSTPEWCEGQLLPTFTTTESTVERAIFAMDSKDTSKYAPYRKGSFMVINGDYKLIHYVDIQKAPAGYELYDLERDPEEMEDLATSHKSTAAELKDLLDKKLEQINQSNPASR